MKNGEYGACPILPLRKILLTIDQYCIALICLYGWLVDVMPFLIPFLAGTTLEDL
jgi:hypothetical protein